MKSELFDLAESHGDALQHAGMALTTLADLVGADGSEHYLTEDEIGGLQHAIKALGTLVRHIGAELYCEAIGVGQHGARQAGR